MAVKLYQMKRTDSIVHFYPVYRYLGDRMTTPALKRSFCTAVMTAGKCIRGRNGNMLVEFLDRSKHVVIARLLRKVP